MRSKQINFLAKAFVLFFVLLSAHSAFADPLDPTDPTTLVHVPCIQHMPLVPNIIAGYDPTADRWHDLLSPTANDQVCVNIPNSSLAQYGNRIVWDIDTPVTTDGLPNTTPASLRHMDMMAYAMEYMIEKVHAGKGVDITGKIHIYGVIHGSALHWALSDAWWKAQVDEDGNQLYPNGNPVGPWIDKLEAFAAKYGMDLHLEVCGVTLYGAGLTNADLYPGILVNGGAFGRFAVLHNQGFLVIQEGWIDNDSMYMKKNGFMMNN